MTYGPNGDVLRTIGSIGYGPFSVDQPFAIRCGKPRTQQVTHCDSRYGPIRDELRTDWRSRFSKHSLGKPESHLFLDVFVDPRRLSMTYGQNAMSYGPFADVLRTDWNRELFKRRSRKPSERFVRSSSHGVC